MNLVININKVKQSIIDTVGEKCIHRVEHILLQMRPTHFYIATNCKFSRCFKTSACQATCNLN